MGSFFPQLQPKYGVDPSTGSPYWPNEEKTQYQRQLVLWMEAAHEEAKHEQSGNEEVGKVGKYIEYIMGKQWGQGRPTYRASPVDNRVWGLMWELVSILTDIRPTFEVKALDERYKDHSEILNSVTRSWWLLSDADMSLAMTIIYGILTTGYCKLEWDPRKRNGEGDFNLLPLGPSDILPLKAKHTLESSQAVIYQSVQPLGWFKQKFPVRGALVQPDPGFSRFAAPLERPGHVPAMLFENLSPQMKRMLSKPGQIKNSTYPEALYREFWIKDYSYNESNMTVLMGDPGTNWCYHVAPGMPLYPRGRLVVMGGSIPLYDGPNPYWHGQFPFGALRLNVVPWQFMGLSELGPLIPLQDIINQILAGVLEAVKKAVNPGFYAPKNAFSDSQWESLDWAMPGLKAGYSAMTTQKPEFAPVPTLPSFVLQLLGIADNAMNRSSGIAAVSQMLQKKQIPSGEGIERLQSAQAPPLRLKGRNIEIFLRDLGQMNIWNTFQFYSAKRRMWMLGSKGTTFEDFDYDPQTLIPAGTSPEDHAKRFAFMIQPGSLLNYNRIEKAMAAMKLRMTGDISRRSLYKFVDLDLDVDKEEAELKREREENIAAMIKQRMQGGNMLKGKGQGM